MTEPDECRICDALLNQDGSCSNRDCSTQPCLQCRKRRCDCPPIPEAVKMALRAELEQERLTAAISKAANERMFPTKQEPNVKKFRADMARRPKVRPSERRARSQAQYNADVKQFPERGDR